MKFGRWLYVGLIPIGLLLGVFLLGVMGLISQSFGTATGWGWAQYIAFFTRSDYVQMLIRTLSVAVLTSAICLIIGYPTAYFVARAKRYRSFLLLLIIAPWLVSVVVRTYGWIFLLGNRGLINAALQWIGLVNRPVPLMFNVTGIVIGLVHVYCPFMIIAILSSLVQVDRSLEEAAMSLGARPSRVLQKVLLPLSLPGVISGTMLVYLMSTGAIVTPLFLGGLRDRMLGTQMFEETFELFNIPKASAMAVIVTLVALMVIAPLQWLEQRVGRHARAALAG